MTEDLTPCPGPMTRTADQESGFPGLRKLKSMLAKLSKASSSPKSRPNAGELYQDADGCKQTPSVAFGCSPGFGRASLPTAPWRRSESRQKSLLVPDFDGNSSVPPTASPHADVQLSQAPCSAPQAQTAGTPSMTTLPEERALCASAISAPLAANEKVPTRPAVSAARALQLRSPKLHAGVREGAASVAAGPADGSRGAAARQGGRQMPPGPVEGQVHVQGAGARSLGAAPSWYGEAVPSKIRREIPRHGLPAGAVAAAAGGSKQQTAAEAVAAATEAATAAAKEANTAAAEAAVGAVAVVEAQAAAANDADEWDDADEAAALALAPVPDPLPDPPAELSPAQQSAPAAAAGQPAAKPAAPSSAAADTANVAAAPAAAAGGSVEAPGTPQPPPAAPSGGPVGLPSTILLAVCPGAPAAMRRPSWSLGDYFVERRLYKSSTSSVYAAVCLRSGLPVALKVYNLNRVPANVAHMLMREIEIQASVVHENVAMLYGAFQDVAAARLVLVQEFAANGDLHDVHRALGCRMSEDQARVLVLRPLLSAVAYLHKEQIIHRDIKPENILFRNDWRLLLADFGVAINISAERAVTRAGTVGYMAPEVERCPIKDRPEDNKHDGALSYTTAADVWAIGCLAYTLLLGFSPYIAGSQATHAGPMVFSFPCSTSALARDFIMLALAERPEDRPTVMQLRKHAWICS